VGLSDGGTAGLWSERVALAGAEAVASYGEGPLSGLPAVTRNTHGSGTAWYVATRPDPTTLASLLDRIRAEAGVASVRTTPERVEAALRRGADADYLFLINHGDDDAEVEVAAGSVELLTGKGITTNGDATTVLVTAGDVAVVREPR
jgi:beta-galactosidase